MHLLIDGIAGGVQNGQAVACLLQVEAGVERIDTIRCIGVDRNIMDIGN